MLVRITNRENPKKPSDLGLHCFSRPFWQITSVPNFRMSTVSVMSTG